MNRAELQALCKRSGLPARGSNAVLIERLKDALLVKRAAGADEEVPVRKGCLKNEAKKVTFAPEEATVWRRSRSNSLGADVPVSRSTRKSMGAYVPLRRSRRNSLGADVPVKQSRRNSMGADVPLSRTREKSLRAVYQKCELRSQVTTRSGLAGAAAVLPPAVEKKRGMGEAAAVQKYTATKGRVRESKQKIVSLSEIYSRGSPHCGRRQSVVSKLHEKEKNVEKQLIVKQPVRLSSHNMLNSGLLAAEMNAEMNVRRSTRKSILPNMLNKENQDPNEMARNENFQSGECQDDGRQQKVKEPIRRSGRSVSAVLLEEQNSGLYEEKISKIPMRRSTRKSVALIEVKKVIMEIQCNAEESIPAADLGKCPSRVSKGNPYSSSLHFEGAADDCILPVLNGDKGCSSDGRPSSFGLERLFAEACKESYSQNLENTVGDREQKSTISGEGRVGLEANATESGEKNLADIISPGLYAKSLHHDTDIIAEETDKAVEKSVCWEASACESAGKRLTGNFSDDLHTKYLQHDYDVLTDETGEASGAAPPLSESDTNLEIRCDTKESIGTADLGKCPSRHSIGNPLPTSLHLEGAADDTSLPVLNADKGCSSDGRPSSFGPELLFADACKYIYSKNTENTSESGEKNLSDIMSTGLYAKSWQHDTDRKAEETGKVAEESIRAADLGKCPSRCSIGDPLSTSLHLEGAAADTSLPELNADKGFSSDGRPSSFELAGPDMESGFSITVKNERLVADILDQQAVLLVDLQEGELENLSLCSATPESKHECDLLEETVLPSKNTGSLPIAEQSPFSLESLGYGALASATAHTENGFDDSKGCHVKSALGNTHVSETFSHHGTEEGISKYVDHMHASHKDHIMEGLRKANHDEERVKSVFLLDGRHIEVINPEEVACEGEGSKKHVHSEDLKASSEETDVNGPGTGNPSLSLATPHYNTEVRSEDAACRMKNYTGTCSDPRHLPMELESLYSEGSTEKSYSNGHDEQIKPELDGDEVEKHFLNCETDTSKILGTGSVMSKTTLLPKDICCQELELQNGLSLFKFAEESPRSGICQSHCQKHMAEDNSRLMCCDNVVLHQDHKEECSELNEDKFTAKARENNMTEDAPVEGTGSSIMLPSVVGTSEMADEQLNTKMSDERICQSSRRRGIDKLCAKGKSFKVSSTIKGSSIAKSAPRPKPWNSLSQSAIAVHMNNGNTIAAKVKPKADRQQPINIRPRDSLSMSKSARELHRNRNGKDKTAAVKIKANKPWL